MTLRVDRRRIISCMALYIMSLQFLLSNSRFSTHWKLNKESSKIEMMEDYNSQDEHNLDVKGDSNDYVFQILNSAIYYHDYWVVEKTNTTTSEIDNSSGRSQVNDDSAKDLDLTQPLSCGPVVNFTTYDHLKAMDIRNSILNFVEPESLPKSPLPEHDEMEVKRLERHLKLEIKNRPNEASVYNSIGSYWRAFGQTQKAINCFRKALTINADNPDSLQNLARMFYNLNYLDDALYLAQRSLDVQLTTGNSAWFHYFSIGEILKAKGDIRQANMNFRIAVKLNPEFKPAIVQLSKFQLYPEVNTNFYVAITLIVSMILVISNLFCSSHYQLEHFTVNNNNFKNCKRRHNNYSLRWQINSAVDMSSRSRSLKKYANE